MTNDSASSSRWLFRAVLLVVVMSLIAALVLNREALSFDALIARQAALQQAAIEQPALVLGSAFVLYVLVTGLSLPGAALLSLAYGWLFGFWGGLFLVSFASTAGATVAFLMSRFLFRDAIRSRFGERLTAINEALAREGAFYLFTLRLIPQVPFFVVNLLMGLTPLRVTTFWWVSQLGMLPGTCVYIYAGSSVSSLEKLRDEGVSGLVTWQLVVAFALLGLFPLIVKRAVSAWKNRVV
jgi:uncharacterized membrane protein YdjX (TVP38/TMEM64 family)